MDRERLGNAVARSLDVRGPFRLRGEEILATAADLNTLAGAASRATGPADGDGADAPPVPSPTAPTPGPAPSGPKVAGGKATIVGAGAVPSGLTSIVSVVASLGQDASADAGGASATWSGDKVTLKVWKVDGTAATAPAVVHWIAVGS